MSYYIRVRGRVQGPFDETKLRSLVQRGLFSRIHEISEDGQSWRPARDESWLFSTESTNATSQDNSAPISDVPISPLGSQPFPNQPFPNQPFPNQPFPNQPFPNQPFPNQPFPGQPFPGQPFPNQPFAGQPFSGQPYPGQPGGMPYGGGPGAPIIVQTNTTSESKHAMNNGKSKVVAGILALFLGGLGVHKFYLGAWGWGLIYLIFSPCMAPALLAFIDAIIYFCASDEAFDKKWNRRTPSPFDF